MIMTTNKSETPETSKDGGVEKTDSNRDRQS